MTPAAAPTVIVVAGPTASGKSALAMRLAEALSGIVINADSQQSYRDLPILTARPTPADEARVPHRLFGTLGPLERDTAPAWAARAAVEIAAAHDAGQTPIVVGGTGLYLHTLMVGLPGMPPIPPAVRTEARALLAEIGHAAFHARLAARDPVLGAKLKTGDTQRLLRAWEVVAATGRPLSAWQADPPVPTVAAHFVPVVILPPREMLYAATDGRFLGMMQAGAAEEVQALRASGVPPQAPVFRALGARAIAAYLDGETSLEEAIRRGQTATRQYAKRQITWFKGQYPAALTICEQFSERMFPDIFPKIRNIG